MNTNRKDVKEITDILKAVDTVMSLVCLLKINRKTNDLADKQRELEARMKAYSKSKSKDMEDTIRTVSSRGSKSRAGKKCIGHLYYRLTQVGRVEKTIFGRERKDGHCYQSLKR